MRAATPAGRPLHIAYDLRYAADHFPGIGTHAYCLLEALLALPEPHRYTVLWNPALPQHRFDLQPVRGHPRVTWVERPLAPVSARALLGVGAWLRAVRPDVYLSPFYLLPVGARCPCVLTLHDVWPLRLPGGLKLARRMFYQLMIARAARARLVITSSEFSRREINELSALDATMVRAVRLGVPPTRGRVEARRPATLPRDPFALVVGVNKPHKNLATIAEVWARLGPRPPVRLVSAGFEDARHPKLGELAARAGAEGVTVLGRVAEDEIEWLYQHATMVLFPTLYEGFGFPLVEAFRHGAAAVASDIPALREIGEGAALFRNPRDVDGWVTAIRDVAGNPRLRADLQDAGLARASELTYERTARATLEVLQEALQPEADPS